MNSEQIAQEMVRLAKELVSQVQEFEDDSIGEFKRLDPQLNVIVNKVVTATDGDISKMLTIIIMALKKTGHQSEATRIFTLFKRMLRRVETILD